MSAEAAERAIDVTLDAGIEYQACDDKVCYPPQSIPVSWTLAVKVLDRK